MANLQKKIKDNILVIILFVSITFLYFHRVPELFTFDIDTEYQTLYAQTLLDNFHIIWIGVSAGSTGFYLGPGLVYLTAFLLWLSQSDPAILGYFSAGIGLLTAASLSFVTKHLYDKQTAFNAVLIYGFSSFISHYHHTYWPIFVPFIALWLFFSLAKGKNDTRWLIFSSVLIGTAFHVHLSLLIFIPFIVWSFITLRKRIDRTTWTFSIFGFLLIISPLIFFDLVHKFTNILTPVRMLKALGQGQSPAILDNVRLLINSVDNIWWWSNERTFLPTLMVTLVTIIALIVLTSNRKKYPNNLLLNIIVVFIFLFSFYPGPIQEYYAVLLFPFVALSGAILLRKLPFSLWVFFSGSYVLLNIYTTVSYTNPRGLMTKKDLISNVSSQLTTDYYLDFDGDIDSEGWRYLFEVYGKRPAQSKADSMFGWLYQEKISDIKPQMKVTVIKSREGLYRVVIE